MSVGQENVFASKRTQVASMNHQTRAVMVVLVPVRMHPSVQSVVGLDRQDSSIVADVRDAGAEHVEGRVLRDEAALEFERQDKVGTPRREQVCVWSDASFSADDQATGGIAPVLEETRCARKKRSCWAEKAAVALSLFPDSAPVSVWPFASALDVPGSMRVLDRHASVRLDTSNKTSAAKVASITAGIDSMSGGPKVHICQNWTYRHAKRSVLRFRKPVLFARRETGGDKRQTSEFHL